jgi:hypothetical protein
MLHYTGFLLPLNLSRFKQHHANMDPAKDQYYNTPQARCPTDREPDADAAMGQTGHQRTLLVLSLPRVDRRQQDVVLGTCAAGRRTETIC